MSQLAFDVAAGYIDTISTFIDFDEFKYDAVIYPNRLFLIVDLALELLK